MNNYDETDSLNYAIYPANDNPGYLERYMNSMIFVPPDRQDTNKPQWIKYVNLPNFKSITYFSLDPEDEQSLDGKSSIPSEKKYILWSHGNGGDLLSHYPVMTTWFEAMNKKIGIIVYDYEGYGFTDGSCSEKNCYNNLTFMIRHAIKELNIKQKNLYLVGQSLGTGIVVDFCSRHRWTTPIILISPYKSISRVIVDPHWFDLLSNIAVDTIDMFKSHHKMHRVQCPVIIYHGLKDKLILPHHSVEMYNNHKNKITLVMLRDADHNNILNHIDLNEITDLIRTSSTNFLYDNDDNSY